MLQEPLDVQEHANMPSMPQDAQDNPGRIMRMMSRMCFFVSRMMRITTSDILLFLEHTSGYV